MLCMETGKKGKHAKGKKGKAKGKGKHKGKHESSPKFEGYCGHCGKWGHKQKYCRYKNTVAEVDEEESVEPPNSSVSSSTTRVTPPLLVCFQLELHSPRHERSPRWWRLTRSLASSVNWWWDLMMHE